MRIKWFALLIILAVCANAVVPSQISFQGVLKDNTGTPITGSRNITFAIYDLSTGGSDLWHEAQTVSVEAGLYNVQLGASTALSAGIFNGATKYLGISIGGGTELLPRVVLVTVPYAYRAEKADQATYSDYSGSSGGIPNSVLFTPTTAQTTSSANAVWIKSSASDTASNGLSVISVEATGQYMVGAKLETTGSNSYGLYAKGKKIAGYFENESMGVMLGASNVIPNYNAAAYADNTGCSGAIAGRYSSGGSVVNGGGAFSASGSSTELGLGLTADMSGGDQYGYAAKFSGGAGIVLPDSTGAVSGLAASYGPGTLEGTVRFYSGDNHFYGWNGAAWKQLDNN